MNPAVISVVLLPNATDTRQLVQCSAAINDQATSLIRLNQHFLPHISIAQFVAPPEEIPTLWKQVQHLKTMVHELTSAGINFHFDAPAKATWMDVHFDRSQAITQLQHEVVRSEFATRFNVHNKVGDNFRPHCTLALFAGSKIPSLDVADQSIFQKQFQDLTLAAGSNGEYYTFVETKFS